MYVQTPSSRSKANFVLILHKIGRKSMELHRTFLLFSNEALRDGPCQTSLGMATVGCWACVVNDVCFADVMSVLTCNAMECN